MMRTLELAIRIWILLSIIGPLWLLVSDNVDMESDVRTASRESAHLAPDPKTTQEAVIQAYSARAFNWRGIFASHCWIATKGKGADTYTVYQVIGWRWYSGLPALMVGQDVPDRIWFNAKPKVILDIRGEKAEALIPRIDEVAKSYPYAKPYTLWPGPNSNTFPAYVAQHIPELGLTLPADAIGKDYLVDEQGRHRFFAPAPSGTGYQFSLYGVFGVLVAKNEGVEINILTGVYGIRFSPFRLLLPGLGGG